MHLCAAIQPAEKYDNRRQDELVGFWGRNISWKQYYSFDSHIPGLFLHGFTKLANSYVILEKINPGQDMKAATLDTEYVYLYYAVMIT